MVTANNMINTVANKNRLIVGCSLVVEVELAEHWSYSAARGYALRDYKAMKGYGDRLITCTLPAYRALGHYYTGVAIADIGQGDCEKALWHYEQALRLCPEAFRPRVYLAMGSLDGLMTGDESGYRKACALASRLTGDVDMFIEAQRGLAILDDRKGRGLERLLSLYPMVKKGSLHIPADWANSVAVELMDAGKIEQAKMASDEAMASPFASAYPEWRTTAHDIASLISDRPAIFFDSNLDLKGAAYRTLLDTLAFHYPSYTVSMLDSLTKMAGMGEGRVG
jgi:hypothetical protein